MENVQTTNLLPIILALIAALPGVFSLFVQMSRGRVENAVDLVNTAMQLKDEMAKELESLRADVEDLEQRQRVAEDRAAKCTALVRALLKDCSALIHQLHSLSIVPVVSFEELETLTEEYYPELRSSVND